MCVCTRWCRYIYTFILFSYFFNVCACVQEVVPVYSKLKKELKEKGAGSKPSA